MVLDLIVHILRGESAIFGPLDSQEGLRQHGAERRQKHLILFQMVRRFGQAAGQTVDASSVELCVAEVARVGQHRLARIELADDAIQAGGDHPAQRQVGIVAAIGRLEFKVDRSRLLAQNGEAMRTAPSRLSGPQAVNALAHRCGLSRR